MTTNIAAKIAQSNAHSIPNKTTLVESICFNYIKIGLFSGSKTSLDN